MITNFIIEIKKFKEDMNKHFNEFQEVNNKYLSGVQENANTWLNEMNKGNWGFANWIPQRDKNSEENIWWNEDGIKRLKSQLKKDSEKALQVELIKQKIEIRTWRQRRTSGQNKQKIWVTLTAQERNIQEMWDTTIRPNFLTIILDEREEF